MTLVVVASCCCPTLLCRRAGGARRGEVPPPGSQDRAGRQVFATADGRSGPGTLLRWRCRLLVCISACPSAVLHVGARCCRLGAPSASTPHGVVSSTAVAAWVSRFACVRVWRCVRASCWAQQRCTAEMAIASKDGGLAAMPMNMTLEDDAEELQRTILKELS